MLRVLVVDDDKLICWSISKALESQGYQVFVAETGEEAVKIFRETDPDVALVDYKLPDTSGLDLLKEIKSQNPNSFVAIMTAYGTIDTAVEAMKLGAFDFITKPIDMEELKLKVQKIADTVELQRSVELSSGFDFKGVDSIIGESAEIINVKKLIKRIANSNAPVLITGETGTGKELVARALHYESERRNKPFVPVNCSAIPQELFESEMFGYEKGAFTDAYKSKRGLIELANGGTVFLDEISDLTPSAQAKLLRIIEEKKLRRVGSSKFIKVDVRIISATNKNLNQLVKQGKFREDLFYRITTFTIELPPLSKRGRDVILLAKYFLRKFSIEYRKKFIDIDPEAERFLLNYKWKGNIRELKNLIERVVIMNDGLYLTREILSSTCAMEPNETTETKTQKNEDNIVPLSEMEKTMIIKALKKAGGNKTKAANLLGITRDALKYKLKKYGLTKWEKKR